MNDQIKEMADKLCTLFCKKWFYNGSIFNEKGIYLDCVNGSSVWEDIASEIVKKNQWRDISTAPKNGTRILAYFKNRDKERSPIGQAVIWWKDGDWCMAKYHGNSIYIGYVPTHWQLLPEPPKE